MNNLIKVIDELLRTYERTTPSIDQDLVRRVLVERNEAVRRYAVMKSSFLTAVKGWVMNAVVLVILSAGPGMAQCGSSFAFSDHPPCASDFYVAENLLRLAKDAEDARIALFLRNLGCENQGNATTGRIVCMSKGKAIAHEWIRAEDPLPALFAFSNAGTPVDADDPEIAAMVQRLKTDY